jgi:hypothetical protein
MRPSQYERQSKRNQSKENWRSHGIYCLKAEMIFKENNLTLKSVGIRECKGLARSQNE